MKNQQSKRKQTESEIQYVPEIGNNLLRSVYEERANSNTSARQNRNKAYNTNQRYDTSQRQNDSSFTSFAKSVGSPFENSKKGSLDYDFSYNGSVNFEKKQFNDKYDETLEKISNAVFLDGSVSLEPRLQEYLRKKILYKRTGIQPQIKLSQTYQITPQDRQAMKNFLNGKKNIYAKGNYNVNNSNVLLTQRPEKTEKFVFLADQLKHDKRVPKLDYTPNKYRNVKNIQTMGMFGEEVYWNNDNNSILDSRDFSVKTNIDNRYAQPDSRANMQLQSITQNTPITEAQTNYPSFNNLGLNSKYTNDRYQIADTMFNKSSRL